MYTFLIFTHSILRWLIVPAMAYALFRGFRGWSRKLPFSQADDTIRHVTATLTHIQLMLGYMLYFNSPFINYFRTHFKEAIRQFDFIFFGMIHITLMTIAIILVTIGSSAAKRQQEDTAKFKTMAIFYTIAFIIILIAIPWPFSPLSARPYLRIF